MRRTVKKAAGRGETRPGKFLEKSDRQTHYQTLIRKKRDGGFSGEKEGQRSKKRGLKGHTAGDKKAQKVVGCPAKKNPAYD